MSVALFAELRQRKLVQWAVAYAAAAFALLQGVDMVAQRFGWPESVARGAIIVACVGFFVTLLLAWYHGERGAQKASGTELLLLAVLLGIGGGLLWRFAGTTVGPGSVAGAGPVVDTMTNPDRRSLAVLPFENLSADADNAYFASGMQDMVLTKLADIGELRVSSRTSTEKYKSHPENIQAIAQELGVAHVLEGSVQKVGNQVLINVQLIDAATDRHLWAQAYTRTLDDIFGVEGEVASMIAQALKAKLSPAEAAAVAQVPTHDKAAYDAYLKARYYLNNSNRSGDREDLVRTVSLLQAATQLDPNFGKAWSLLALAYVKLGGHAKQQAEAARRALEIDPDDANAQIQAAFVHSAEGEHDLAVGLGERAARSQPGAGAVQAGLGWIYLFAGRFDEGAAAFGRAIAVEPNAVSIRLFQSTALSGMRRYAESRETLQAGQARDPGDMSIVLDLAKLQILERGDLDAARKVLQSASATPAQSVPLAEGWFDVLRLARDYPAALALLAQAPEGMFAQGGLTRPHFQARVFQAQGDVARARKASLEARDAMQAHVEAAPAHPAGHAGLALALAGAGDCDAALASARRALELQPVARNAVWGMMWSYVQAQVTARCGHADDAVAQLRQLLREPAGNLVSVPWLKLDPDWDPIRGDAGFQALLAEKD